MSFQQLRKAMLRIRIATWQFKIVARTKVPTHCWRWRPSPRLRVTAQAIIGKSVLSGRWLFLRRANVLRMGIGARISPEWTAEMNSHSSNASISLRQIHFRRGSAVQGSSLPNPVIKARRHSIAAPETHLSMNSKEIQTSIQVFGIH